MNQLEAFKWEQKRMVEEPKTETEDLVVDEVAQARKIEEEIRERELGELEKLVQAQARRHNTTQDFNTTVVDLGNSTKRRADSESIYAFIIRRVNDLEGNSSLVARYIDEQSKAMRAMLDRTETEILKKLEVEDRTRWEQEVSYSATLLISECAKKTVSAESSRNWNSNELCSSWTGEASSHS